MENLDTIMSYISQGLLVLALILVYVLLVGYIYPMIFMRPKRVSGESRDRGIKKYVYPDGRCVVYEPEFKVRRFVSQYELFTKDGFKYIKCKTNPNVKSICYFVLAYDNRNKLIDTLKVFETVKTKGYTRSVELPYNTSYVSFVLYRVDDTYNAKKKLPIGFSPVNIILYSACVIVTTLIHANLSKSLWQALLKGVLPISRKEVIFPALIFGVFIILISLWKFYHNVNKVNKK